MHARTIQNKSLPFRSNVYSYTTLCFRHQTSARGLRLSLLLLLEYRMSSSVPSHSSTYRGGVLWVSIQAKQIEMPGFVLLWSSQKCTPTKHFWNRVSVKGRKQQSPSWSSETEVKLANRFPRPVVADLPLSSPSTSPASGCLLSESSTQVLELTVLNMINPEFLSYGAKALSWTLGGQDNEPVVASLYKFLLIDNHRNPPWKAEFKKKKKKERGIQGEKWNFLEGY